MDATIPLGWLEEPVSFAARLASLPALDLVDRAILLEQLDRHLTSSSWVTARLFKPMVRNLHVQGILGAPGMFKKLELFLGDQEYHFKFFFQDAMRRGAIPTVLDVLHQAINMPRFRFRLEAIDMVAELDPARAIPALCNLLSGMAAGDPAAGSIHARVDAALEVLAPAVDAVPALAGAFRELRLLLAARDPAGS